MQKGIALNSRRPVKPERQKGGHKANNYPIKPVPALPGSADRDPQSSVIGLERKTFTRSELYRVRFSPSQREPLCKSQRAVLDPSEGDRLRKPV